MLQQLMQYFFIDGKISFAFGRIFILEKISRMPSAEMENFVEHTPGKALKILRRL